MEAKKDEILNYINLFYPEYLGADTVRLEYSRISTASIWKGTELDIRGWSAIPFIQNILLFDDISTELRKHIETNLLLLPLDKNENIREIVKKIWMFRKDENGNIIVSYPPWRLLSDQNHSVYIEAKIEYIDEKIYAVFSLENLTLLYNSFRNITKNLSFNETDWNNFVLNDEAGHITIVNSDKIAKVGKEDTLKFSSNYSIVKCATSKFKHTISLDWPLFGPCVVVGVISSDLDNFISNWNEKFPHAKINPSLHTTIAIISRKI